MTSYFTEMTEEEKRLEAKFKAEEKWVWLGFIGGAIYVALILIGPILV